MFFVNSSFSAPETSTTRNFSRHESNLKTTVLWDTVTARQDPERVINGMMDVINGSYLAKDNNLHV